MLAAIDTTLDTPRPANQGYCTACFSHEYPIDIPQWLFADDREKLIFEEAWG